MVKTIDAVKLEDLEKCISKAMKKVNVNGELLLSRYIPGSDGKRMHHLQLPRIKKDNPKQLLELLEKHIIKPKNPKQLPALNRGVKRQSRGLNVLLSQEQFTRLIEIVRSSGDQEILTVLRKQRPLKTLQKQVVKMANSGEFNAELIREYEEIVHTKSAG